MVICLTGCGNSTKKGTVISPDDYKQKMEEKGFSVYDGTENYKNSEYDYIEKFYVSNSSNLNYTIFYYKMDSSKNAKSFFNSIVNSWVNLEKEYNIIEEDSILINETPENYSFIIQKDNYLMYAVVSTDYKAEVNNIFEACGFNL